MPSNDTQQFYKEHALSPKSKDVRVLDILPAPVPTAVPSDTPIRANIRVVNLDSDPEFTALSYVWGTYAVQPHVILCNEVRFEVTSNCYSALWHLREKLGQFTIWADAICINQADLDEKSQQIPLMGDIYSKAAFVYAWLGEGSPSLDRAMSYLSTAGLQQYIEALPDGTKKTRPYLAVWSLYTSGLHPTYHPFPFRSHGAFPIPKRIRQKPWISQRGYTYWDDLIQLFDQAWVRRVWTYQEILLASRPVLVCGDSHLAWDDLARGLLFLSDRSVGLRKHVVTWKSIVFDRARLHAPSHFGSGTPSLTLREHENFVKKIHVALRFTRVLIPSLLFVVGIVLFALGIHLTDSRCQAEFMAIVFLGCAAIFACIPLVLDWPLRDFFPEIIPGATNDNLVNGLYERSAKDPKDMGYGMWAILQRRGATGLPSPTYTRDTGVIYRQLTVSLIQITGSAEFLFLAAAQRQPGVPSWVPDWSARGKHQWTITRDFYERSIPFGPDPIYWLGITKIIKDDRSKQVLSVDQAQAVLTVRARELGSIRLCAPFHQTSETYHDSEKDLHLANLQSMIHCADGPFARGFSQTNGALLRQAGQKPPGRSGMGKYLPETNFSGKYFARARRERLEQTFRRWTEGRETPKWFNVEFLPTFTKMCNLLARADRKFCHASSSGDPDKHYLTACAPHTRVGDRILKVIGLPDAVVVREVPGPGNSIEIMSPVALPTNLFWWSDFGRSMMDPNAPGFVEYQIH